MTRQRAGWSGSGAQILAGPIDVSFFPKASIRGRILKIKSHVSIVGIVTTLLDGWHPDQLRGPPSHLFSGLLGKLIVTVELKAARKYFAFVVFFAL